MKLNRNKIRNVVKKYRIPEFEILNALATAENCSAQTIEEAYEIWLNSKENTPKKRSAFLRWEQLSLIEAEKDLDLDQLLDLLEKIPEAGESESGKVVINKIVAQCTSKKMIKRYYRMLSYNPDLKDLFIKKFYGLFSTESTGLNPEQEFLKKVNIISKKLQIKNPGNVIISLASAEQCPYEDINQVLAILEGELDEVEERVLILKLEELCLKAAEETSEKFSLEILFFQSPDLSPSKKILLAKLLPLCDNDDEVIDYLRAINEATTEYGYDYLLLQGMIIRRIYELIPELIPE